MKTFSLVFCLTLFAASCFQGWMAVKYQLLTRRVDQRQAEVIAEGERLKKAGEQYKSLPKPWVEILSQQMTVQGVTNIHCLVWGEHNGKIIGFFCKSNEITFLPDLEIQMKAVQSLESAARHKL